MARRDQELRANLGFRSNGRPEFWDPLTGTTTPVSVYSRQGTHTFIPLNMPAAGSVFVVFRKGENGAPVTRIERNGTVLVDAADTTQTDKGNPPRIQGLKRDEPVQPWVEHKTPAAEVIDGGRKLLVWEPGNYRVLNGDKLLLETSVVGTQPLAVQGPWRNRLAYDASLPESQRKTWTIAGPPANVPRNDAGLKGPVVLTFGNTVAIPPEINPMHEGTKLVKSGAGVPPAFPRKDGSRDGRPTSENSPNLLPFPHAACTTSF